MATRRRRRSCVTVPASANQPPNAAFTSAVTGLTVQVDSAGSLDPDGRIVSRVWDFGDGATDRSVATSHTFASAGTYPGQPDSDRRPTATTSLHPGHRRVPAATGPRRPSWFVASRALEAVGRRESEQGRGYWTFQVQKRRANGTWRGLSSYRTHGSRETRLLNLPKGTYRVWVRPKYGYSGAMSVPFASIR